MAGEMVEFPAPAYAAWRSTSKKTPSASSSSAITWRSTEGDEVRTTGQLLQVPVGDALIGRVVDPLGNPIDGKGPIVTDQSPARRDRSPPASPNASRSSQPLQTGIKAIDAMTPIGRGQRELIIGDRKTGKTAIAVDTIINQKGENVVCVYVAIGQKESTVASAVESLAGTARWTTRSSWSSSAADAAPLQYHRPVCRLRDGRVSSCTNRAATRCASMTT